MNAKNAVLPIVCTALAALYFLHPLIQAARKNTLPVKSAIINPVEKNDIVQIALESADGSKITLVKVKNLWTGHIEVLDAVFPCVTVQVDSFIDELTAIKKTYPVPRTSGETVFSENSADFVMSWTLSGGKTKSVHIGGRDFSNTMRFIQAENGAVSKIECGFDAYLDTSTRFWCDPYIIPRLWSGGSAAAENIQRISFIADGKRIVLKAGANGFMPRFERLSALRHGELVGSLPPPAETPVLRIEAEFSNEFISVPVYRADDGTYLLQYNLRGGSLHYCVVISGQTFNRLTE
ncbi:MAG: hypothetical protein ACTTKX_06555 [Treponema sp.]